MKNRVTEVKRFTGVVVFTPLANEEPDERRGSTSGDLSALDYFRSRERAERAAAKRAECSVARSVHQALALQYAALTKPYDGAEMQPATEGQSSCVLS